MPIMPLGDMSVLMCLEPAGVVQATGTHPTQRTLETYLWESFPYISELLS